MSEVPRVPRGKKVGGIFAILEKLGSGGRKKNLYSMTGDIRPVLFAGEAFYATGTAPGRHRDGTGTAPGRHRDGTGTAPGGPPRPSRSRVAFSNIRV
jgi:hypothetical protein